MVPNLLLMVAMQLSSILAVILTILGPFFAPSSAFAGAEEYGIWQKRIMGEPTVNARGQTHYSHDLLSVRHLRLIGLEQIQSESAGTRLTALLRSLMGARTDVLATDAAAQVLHYMPVELEREMSQTVVQSEPLNDHEASDEIKFSAFAFAASKILEDAKCPSEVPALLPLCSLAIHHSLEQIARQEIFDPDIVVRMPLFYRTLMKLLNSIPVERRKENNITEMVVSRLQYWLAMYPPMAGAPDTPAPRLNVQKMVRTPVYLMNARSFLNGRGTTATSAANSNACTAAAKGEI